MYASEPDVKNTVQEFITFCEYIESEKPFATPKGDLATKGCYAINQLLTRGKKDAKPTNRLQHYPSISLWFAIARESGLIAELDAKGSKTFYNVTDKYEDFKKLNVFSQYLLLFQTWYCFVDMEVQYGDRGIQMFVSRLLDSVFVELCKNGSADWITNGKNQNRGIFASTLHYLFDYSYKTTHDLMNFGILEFEESGENAPGFSHPLLSKIRPTSFGLLIMKACETKKYSTYNVCARDFIELDDESGEIVKIDSGDFLMPFLECFPNGSIDVTGINKLAYGYQPDENNVDSRIFEFKVSLGKKCYRIIQCLPQHTFEDLHDEIQNAFGFDNDHLYSFYLSGEKYSRNAVHSPYTEDYPSADEMTLSEARFRDKQRVMYHFDYGDDWIFDIVVGVNEAESSTKSFKKPKTVKSVGDAPEQYARYEYDY
ncbi:MAG: plasmid pRiA4b ORF-3 family protein [Defluviitaleaceae bacterium]|nr:plasmid pRiA4b ORF-3 family protein [Defluviitaleaceae bacterium]